MIDYTTEDFTAGEARFDVIVQLAGMASPAACRRALISDGTLVLSSGDSEGRWIGPVSRIVKALALAPFVSQAMRPLVAKPNRCDLARRREMIEAERVTPVIDRVYELDRVSEAIEYVETGHARGKVVIRV